MDSILQSRKECYMCRTTLNLAKHHVFYGTANRKLSEKYGLTIWLCPEHHNMSDKGIHFNKPLDLQIKQIAQREFEDTYGHEEFMRIFGRNYIDSK